MSLFGIKTNRIEFWSFLAIRWSISKLSIGMARRLGSVTGLLSFYSFLRRRHYALRNLKLVFPDQSRAERHRLAREIYRRTGASLLESAIWTTRDASADPDVFEVEGAEHIERLIASGGGFTVLGAHYGVWETGLMPYEKETRPVTVIAKQTANPLMQAEADAWRERRGFIQVLSEGATLKIFRALKRGDRVGVIGDQRVKPEDGILLPFLGVPAWSSPMTAAMSIRTGTPVLPYFAEPLGRDRYRVRYLEPIEPDPELGKGEEAIREMTRRYSAVVEEQILARPELWFWVHERWNRIKKYRWRSTKDRWRKRSGLPASASEGAVPEPLRAVIKAYRRGKPLQDGECLVVDGATFDQRRAAVASMGFAVIEAGRSFGWVEEGATGRLAEESVFQIDQFDVVAVCFADSGNGTASEAAWDRDRIEALVRHRLQMCRSVVFVANDQVDLGALLGKMSAVRTVRI